MLNEMNHLSAAFDLQSICSLFGAWQRPIRLIQTVSMLIVLIQTKDLVSLLLMGWCGCSS